MCKGGNRGGGLTEVGKSSIIKSNKNKNREENKTFQTRKTNMLGKRD